MIDLREVEPDDKVVDAFARLREAGIDTTGGLQSVEEILSGCHVFALSIDDVDAIYYALRIADHAYGREGIIDGAALANRTTRALGETQLQIVSAMIDRQFAAAGCASVSLWTRRRGMVREAARAGYRIDGYQMRKALCALNS